MTGRINVPGARVGDAVEVIVLLSDRMIVATARVLDCPILTLDEKILGYPHVRHG